MKSSIFPLFCLGFFIVGFSAKAQTVVVPLTYTRQVDDKEEALKKDIRGKNGRVVVHRDDGGPSTRTSAVDIQKRADEAARNAEYAAGKQAEKEAKSANEKSRKDVTRCYPQSLIKGDPLNNKVEELWGVMVANKNPIINDPDAPFIVYSMAAATLNISPAMPR